ncbi:Retrovirus-related Pol polyprotein from transposon TNT 1-94 [Dendrobium catenatum]|uniref:Retrovirus-related Pol polyprotein from transposon TNT 1-94 n=1 Tax=Dendrobium catenatum TaxID=906689 RepID=A0A2I0W0Z6_9ASPA|nr:Retrovirus-related Pol polyprotein from transposon TNT 1-94 [Dendrobium catenatum]
MADSASSRLQDRSDGSQNEDPMIPATLKFVVSNLRNLVTAPLSPDNFMIWKSQITKTLRANGFIHFLDPNAASPSPTIRLADGSTSANPSYAQWILTDQNLSASICSTISPSILPYVISLESTAQVWSALETRFQATNHSKVMQLKNALHNVALKTQSMEDYLSEIKTIVDQIAAAGCNLEAEDVIHYILNGLPPPYQSFKSSIRTNPLPLTLDQIYPLLLSEEINLASDAAKFSIAPDPNMALFSNRGRGRRSRAKNTYGSSTEPRTLTAHLQILVTIPLLTLYVKSAPRRVTRHTRAGIEQISNMSLRPRMRIRRYLQLRTPLMSTGSWTLERHPI